MCGMMLARSIPALRDSILEQSRRHPGAALTNFGGWHSEPGILKSCGNAGQQLTGHIHAMIEEATARLYAEFAGSRPLTNWALDRLGEYQPARRFQRGPYTSRRDLVGRVLRG